MNTIRLTIACVVVLCFGSTLVSAQNSSVKKRTEHYRVENGNILPVKKEVQQVHRIDPNLKIVERRSNGNTRHSTDGGRTWHSTKPQESTRSTNATSSVIETKVSSKQKSSIQLFPNPTNAIASCRINSSGSWRLDLLDMKGDRIKEIEKGEGSDDLEVSIVTSDLPSGRYFVRLSDGNGTHFQSLIKQ